MPVMFPHDKYSEDIRRIIYTTNSIEAVHTKWQQKMDDADPELESHHLAAFEIY